MTARNDITGDSIATRPNSQAYADGWDRIFGKKTQEAIPAEPVTQELIIEELDPEWDHMYMHGSMFGTWMTPCRIVRENVPKDEVEVDLITRSFGDVDAFLAREFVQIEFIDTVTGENEVRIVGRDELVKNDDLSDEEAE